MSEYQYYEFQAIDRRLTRDQMAELRAITSRAEITPTSLTNTYEWGDFKGDPVALLVTHFDAHLYDSNWGVRTLMFSFPGGALDLAQLQSYRAEAVADYEAGLMVLEQGNKVIVTFGAYEEEPADWSEDEASEVWLPGLLSLRADIANGDLRALYLGWLAGATYGLVPGQTDDEDDDDLAEPPVPPGLARLTEPLKTLARFLHLDLALVEVAAERSEPLRDTRLPERAVKAWIAALPTAEKEDLLLRLVRGEAQLQAGLLRRLRADLTIPGESGPSADTPRTAAELVRAGRERAAQLKQQHVEAEKREREARLDRLAGQEAQLWEQVERQVDQRNVAGYGEAVRILTDLRDLAARALDSDAFAARVRDLRQRHRRKIGFVERLERARLA